MKILLLAILVITSVGCASKAIKQSAVTIELRYKALWHLVDSEDDSYENLLVHIASSNDKNTALWVLLPRYINTNLPRNWFIECENSITYPISENIVDPTFGVVHLIVERTVKDTTQKCNIGFQEFNSQVSITLPSLDFAPLSDLSFLSYSCSEPFTSKPREQGKSGILKRDISLWLRMQSRANGEYGTTTSGDTIPFKPEFVLGLGDQVYTDPDPSGKEKKRLAFFGGDSSNEWYIDTSKKTFEAVFKTMYRYNFALPPQNRTFSHLQSKMMWDDHEIRDGWGSHGDETGEIDGEPNNFPLYYKVARHAFIAHQYLRSVEADRSFNQKRYDKLLSNNQSLHTEFSKNESNHFLMLDSRSKRNTKSSLFDTDSKNAIERWLDLGSTNRPDTFILTVGTPLFPSKRGEGFISFFSKELRDDLNDGWGSEHNQKSRVDLVKRLEKHFDNNPLDRLIVLSGDVHFSAIFALKNPTGRVYGHEVVTSGIAHALPSVAMAGNYFLNIPKNVSSTSILPLGKINHSATFTEIILRNQGSETPTEVDLIFHTNGTKVNPVWGDISWVNSVVNKIRGKESWVLTNMHLQPRNPINLNTNCNCNKELWYHKYNFKEHGEGLHIAEASKFTSKHPGVKPAGLLINLDLKISKLEDLKITNGNVSSDIQLESAFCGSEFDYNNSLATSWSLPSGERLEGATYSCE
jgi:hypothetical protein